ncbi:hypothetical protein FHS14_005150 [Paenibacillus baekrokdamisoli]|nr:YwmB family TATA-box binding protein [Paenibacillus baekrokdamisoli]MBB3072135.1 hypothetical protein [Paenibacillus baekrokdamisoli]
MIAAGWSVWQVRENQKQTVGSTLQKDFSAIWSWSEDELKGGSSGARWSFRWDGHLKRSDAEEAASQLGIDLKATAVNTYEGKKEELDGHNKLTIWIHTDQQQQSETVKTMSTAVQKDEPVDLVILFEPEKGSAYKRIANAMTSIEKTIIPLEASIKGSFALRGIPISQDAAGQIALRADAKQQETYDDGHTSSNTYLSSKLRSQVSSGTKMVNLQIAEAASSAGISAELIVGVPLITGDYIVPN